MYQDLSCDLDVQFVSQNVWNSIQFSFVENQWTFILEYLKFGRTVFGNFRVFLRPINLLPWHPASKSPDESIFHLEYPKVSIFLLTPSDP